MNHLEASKRSERLEIVLNGSIIIMTIILLGSIALSLASSFFWISNFLSNNV